MFFFPLPFRGAQKARPQAVIDPRLRFANGGADHSANGEHHNGEPPNGIVGVRGSNPLDSTTRSREPVDANDRRFAGHGQDGLKRSGHTKNGRVLPSVFTRGEVHPLHRPIDSVRRSSGPLLGAAILLLLDAKKTSGCRPAYVRSLRQYLAQFSRGREHEPLESISVDTIETWFSSRGEAAAVRSSNVGRISALFSFAIRKGWLKENPCDRLERVVIPVLPPTILTVQQSWSLMRYVHLNEVDSLGWYVVCLFAGIRPAEADRLTWDKVREGEGIIVVDAAIAKTHQRRVVRLMPTAAQWLAAARAAESRLPVPHATRRRSLRRSREHLTLPSWPQDILRHTAASYWYAHSRDAAQVASDLGHSPAILLKHYRELVSKHDADRFWAITPD